MSDRTAEEVALFVSVAVLALNIASAIYSRWVLKQVERAIKRERERRENWS